LTNPDGFENVQWDPEAGYPEKLPPKFYPAASSGKGNLKQKVVKNGKVIVNVLNILGTGITLGFTAVLDAEMSEYYCSSTNGPGFKVGLMGSKYSLSQAISFYHLENPLISFITQRNALNYSKP